MFMNTSQSLELWRHSPLLPATRPKKTLSPSA